MRIFNKGRRSFIFHEHVIKPGKITDIDAKYDEEAKKLLVTYKNELEESGSSSDPSVAAVTAQNAEQAAEIIRLKAQVAKLQRLLVEDPKSQDPKAVANRRAREAEEKLTEAMERVKALEAELYGLPKEAPAKA